MKMLLYINDQPAGVVTSYTQDRPRGGWCFTLADGAPLLVPFSKIKRFTSSGVLDITTY